MKVVLDTNVIVAAFAARGLCSSVLELCLDRCEIVLSETILEETHRHLKGKIGLPDALSSDIICYLRKNCVISPLDEVDTSTCRDEDDLHVLGLAKAAGVSYVITGDKDLLELKAFLKTRFVTPRRFWEIMKNG